MHNSLEKRIKLVCEYINHNLNESLTLDKMSGIAALSKYHFHRVFSAYTGVSVTQFAQLQRLKRASFRLAFEKDIRVIDIALEASFESAEAFSRAFKRTFEQSPSDFRSVPQWQEWHSRFNFLNQTHGETQMKVDIVEFAATKIALLEHLGSPDTVYETAKKFIDWRKETGLSPIKTSKTFGIPYSDPQTTEPEKFRWDICGEVSCDVLDNNYGVKTGIIPAGRCATFRHQGSYDNIRDAICYVYREWLAENNEELRDFPCFFHYRNFIHEVDECDLQTDIYIPLAAKD
ncbi:AraC family transcriptional regulator [Saccharobesus litoralis]|uniref:AraC family transcriptional regulator n=1 Tax=Saccharobesus litoralis TaxID=2172099 RepID=A0A2S0VXG3_9ALTE|nr:AraC family transcriptional regulator [Saccharobesus litoralis]